jgi:hypothetical protein
MVFSCGTKCSVTKCATVNVLLFVSVIYACMEQNCVRNKTAYTYSHKYAVEHLTLWRGDWDSVVCTVTGLQVDAEESWFISWQGKRFFSSVGCRHQL